MAQPQTVTGVFDNVAEAQQAVQHLLAAGFTSDHIRFSAPPHPPVTDKKRGTGRFLSSLFGHSTPSGPTLAGQNETSLPVHRSAAIVIVQVQSTLQVDQALGALAAATTVTVSQPEA